MSCYADSQNAGFVMLRMVRPKQGLLYAVRQQATVLFLIFDLKENKRFKILKSGFDWLASTC